MPLSLFAENQFYSMDVMSDSTCLLVDNSNTRTKFMRASAGALYPNQLMIPTAEISPQSLQALLSDWSFSSVLISSVVPKQAALLSSYFTQPCHTLSPHSSLNFSLENYAGRATLGADRIANVAALAARGYDCAIAIDLGTAVTYDVLAQEDGCLIFKGGIIAAGLPALTSYLHRNTALLPAIDASMPLQALAQNTHDAMHAGAVYGFCGMLRETLKRICDELPSRPYIVATGGDAALITAMLSEIDSCDSSLTFEGLAALADIIFAAEF